MMLFWAGLRGAVGVALAAGIKGDSGDALRTTVLVTVVLTMVLFGGTTSRMIEIVGIRTGVAEDDSSSEDEEPMVLRGNAYQDLNRSLDSKLTVRNENEIVDTPYRDYNLDPYGPNNGSVKTPTRSPPLSARKFSRNFSQGSFESDESDQEVLPMANEGDLPPEGGAGNHDGAVWRDGQWFNVLDERYLLPVFSNATASRRQATRKALRVKSRSQLHLDQMPDSEGDLGTGGESPSLTDSPWLGRSSNRTSWGVVTENLSNSTPRSNNSSKGQQEFTGSFGTVLSSLVGSSMAGNLPSPSTSGKRRESDEEGTMDLTVRPNPESTSRYSLT